MWRSRDELNSILQQAPVGLTVLTPNGERLYCNADMALNPLISKVKAGGPWGEVLDVFREELRRYRHDCDRRPQRDAIYRCRGRPVGPIR